MSSLNISSLLHGIEIGKYQFADVVALIDEHYHYQPIEFYNGTVFNSKATNEGSAKVFSLAQLHGLNQVDTLKLFAEHHQAVLANPEGDDHANIRNFMYYGWQGFGMPKNALTAR